MRCTEDGRLRADLIATKGESRQYHYRLTKSEVGALAQTDWRERALNGQAKKPRRRKSSTRIATQA